MTWRHAEDDGRGCEMAWRDSDERCGCTALTPDPASPCGFEGCLVPPNKRWHVWADDLVPDGLHHERVPTRCLSCGHSITEVHDAGS